MLCWNHSRTGISHDEEETGTFVKLNCSWPRLTKVWFPYTKKRNYIHAHAVEPDRSSGTIFKIPTKKSSIIRKFFLPLLFIQKLNLLHTKIDFVILNQERDIYNKTACLPGTVVQPSLPSGTTSSPLLFCLLRLLSRPPVPRFAKLYSWFLLTAWEFSRW